MDIASAAGASARSSVVTDDRLKLLQQSSGSTTRAPKIIALLARASAADVASARGGYGVLSHVLLAQHDRPDLVDALLAARADIGATDSDGRTTLHWAASAGRLQCALTLLSHNADSTRRDEERLSPLDLARREHHSDLSRSSRASRCRRGPSFVSSIQRSKCACVCPVCAVCVKIPLTFLNTWPSPISPHAPPSTTSSC